MGSGERWEGASFPSPPQHQCVSLVSSYPQNCFKTLDVCTLAFVLVPKTSTCNCTVQLSCHKIDHLSFLEAPVQPGASAEAPQSFPRGHQKGRIQFLCWTHRCGASSNHIKKIYLLLQRNAMFSDFLFLARGNSVAQSVYWR